LGTGVTGVVVLCLVEPDDDVTGGLQTKRGAVEALARKEPALFEGL
jgi:hypothetical protein